MGAAPKVASEKRGVPIEMALRRLSALSYASEDESVVKEAMQLLSLKQPLEESFTISGMVAGLMLSLGNLSSTPQCTTSRLTH